MVVCQRRNNITWNITLFQLKIYKFCSGRKILTSLIQKILLKEWNIPNTEEV